jgi:hypothetical protein
LIKYDEEIFAGSEEAIIPVIWHLINMLGGKVVISPDPKFWDDNIPSDAGLVMYKEDDKIILAAERLDTSDN